MSVVTTTCPKGHELHIKLLRGWKCPVCIIEELERVWGAK